MPFLYVPAFLNVVTTGNRRGTNNVFKWNHALGFEFSIQFLNGTMHLGLSLVSSLLSTSLLL